MTPEVRAKLEDLGENVTVFLRQHIRGDHGLLSKKEAESIVSGAKMVSLFQLSDGTKVLVTTSSDLETILTLYYSEEMEDET